MSRDELGHLEHRDLRLTAEDRPELVVGVDLGPHLRVLEPVSLDIGPELFGELRARQRARANDGSECIVRLDRSHEGGIRFALGSFLFGFRHGG
jgi:hypothetical protein